MVSLEHNAKGKRKKLAHLRSGGGAASSGTAIVSVAVVLFV